MRFMLLFLGKSLKFPMPFLILLVTTLCCLSLFPKNIRAISVYTFRSPRFHVSPIELKGDRFIQIPAAKTDVSAETAFKEDIIPDSTPFSKGIPGDGKHGQESQGISSSTSDGQHTEKLPRGQFRKGISETYFEVTKEYEGAKGTKNGEPQGIANLGAETHGNGGGNLFYIEDDEFHDDYDLSPNSPFVRDADDKNRNTYLEGGASINGNEQTCMDGHYPASHYAVGPNPLQSQTLRSSEHSNYARDNPFNSKGSFNSIPHYSQYTDGQRKLASPVTGNQALQEITIKFTGQNKDDCLRSFSWSDKGPVDPGVQPAETYSIRRTDKGYISYEDYVKWCYEIRGYKLLYDRFGNQFPNPRPDNYPSIIVPEDFNPYMGYSFTELCQTAAGASLKGGKANQLTPFLFVHTGDDTYKIYHLPAGRVGAPAHSHDILRYFESFWTILYLPGWLECPIYTWHDETAALSVSFQPGAVKLVPYLMTRKGEPGNEFKLFRISEGAVINPSPPNGSSKFGSYFTVLYLPEGAPAQRYLNKEEYERVGFPSIQEYINYLEIPPESYWNERWRRTFGFPPLKDYEHQRIYNGKIDYRPGYEGLHDFTTPVALQERAQPLRGQHRPILKSDDTGTQDPNAFGAGIGNKFNKECRETKPRPILYVHEHDNIYSALFLPVLPAYDPFIGPDGKRYERFYVVLYQPPCTNHRYDDGSTINDEYYYNIPSGATSRGPECYHREKRAFPVGYGYGESESVWDAGCMCPKTAEAVKRDEITKSEQENDSIWTAVDSLAPKQEARSDATANAKTEANNGRDGFEKANGGHSKQTEKSGALGGMQNGEDKQKYFQQMGSSWFPYPMKNTAMNEAIEEEFENEDNKGEL